MHFVTRLVSSLQLRVKQLQDRATYFHSNQKQSFKNYANGGIGCLVTTAIISQSPTPSTRNRGLRTLTKLALTGAE